MKDYMKFFEILKKSIFIWKYKLYKPLALNFFSDLKKSSILPDSIIRADSFVRFKNIFEYAYNNNIYYREKYEKAGIRPGDIKTVQDIHKIPTLTKQDVKENILKILAYSNSSRNIVKGSTGGSTGVPMTYFYDKRIPLESFAWRYLNWWGLDPWDDGAFIWRRTRVTELMNFINKVAWWPVKKIKLDASHLNDATLNNFVRLINLKKPKLIQGYVGAIHELALHIKENNLLIHTPKAIWVTSAPVSIIQRSLIETTFKAPLYDEYGSSEIPWIAAQCKLRKGLHVNSEGRFLEIIGADENGEGDVVITDLLNYSFPFIRYELGDRTKFLDKKCGCGVNLPLISNVKGRAGDMIVLSNNQKYDGSFLTTIFDEVPDAVVSFQIIQKKSNKLVLRVAPNYNNLKWRNEVEMVLLNLSKIIGAENSVILEIVDKIISDRGKTRYIINETKDEGDSRNFVY